MATHSSIFLPGKSHGQRSLADYSSWVCKELDTEERTHMHMVIMNYAGLMRILGNANTTVFSAYF